MVSSLQCLDSEHLLTQQDTLVYLDALGRVVHFESVSPVEHSPHSVYLMHWHSHF